MTQTPAITHTHRNVSEAIAPPHTRLKDQYASNMTLCRKYRHLSQRLLVYWLHLSKTKNKFFDAGARIYERASERARLPHKRHECKRYFADRGPRTLPDPSRTPDPAPSTPPQHPTPSVKRSARGSYRTAPPHPTPLPPHPPRLHALYDASSARLAMRTVRHTIHSGGVGTQSSPAPCFLHM